MGFAGFASLAAIVVAAVFVWAAASKLRTRDATVDSFEALSLPAPRFFATAVPVIELAVAFALVTTPQWGGLFAIALLVGFTVYLWLLRRDGITLSCACFGARAEAPIGRSTLVRNLFLLGLATAAAANPASRLTSPGPGSGALMAALSLGLLFVLRQLDNTDDLTRQR